MASQSADTEDGRNQDHPLRPPVPSIRRKADRLPAAGILGSHVVLDDGRPRRQAARFQDRKSTRLNSSHVSISYAVFCLKKKTTTTPLCMTLSDQTPPASSSTSSSSP